MENSKIQSQNIFDVVSESQTSGDCHGFASAVTVWINKPHVINRRLCGSRINHCEIIPKASLNSEVLKRLLDKVSVQPIDTTVIAKLCPVNDVDFHADIQTELCPVSEISMISDIEEDMVCVIVRELLPKQPERHRNMPELIIYDKASETFTFVPLKPVVTTDTEWTEVAYSFTFLAAPSRRVLLSASCNDCTHDSDRKLSLTWLQTQLLTKLARWSEEPNLKTSLTSLTLISLEHYSRLYSELKNKYGLHFAKVWPEKTDPQKFVFEDVAIATYLLLLWKQDRERKGLTSKQTFVDLGCGNGLLVHILAAEGHTGYGLDVRKRKIWELYGSETVLKEQAVIPSSDSLFPDCDWLIGNHSDELTPWIPVMAARTSYKCCYFVLPCCHFDFNAKFSYDTQFIQAGLDDGQYRCYLNFVKTVGEKCGFNVEEDMLRIPSTKRVCFIGRSRAYNEIEETEVDQLRKDFISLRCQQPLDDPSDTSDSISTDKNKTKNWANEFTPRSKIEVTRNCVAIKKETKDTVIQTVFDRLIGCDKGEVKQDHCGKSWRKGGYIPISGVADMFDKDLLQELKCECGGLQTLLRNSSHIFQVSSGTVQLRDFTLADPFEGRKNRGRPSDREDYYKTGLCWFYGHHPDGCPRVTDNCLYAHGEHELLPRPVKEKKKLVL